MIENDTFDTILYELFVMTRQYETAPDWAMGLKLSEEVGEVNEAVLFSNGYVQHKIMKEDVMHEVADVFNVCIALLVKHYPGIPIDQLFTEFAAAVEKKGRKYAKVIGALNQEVSND